MKKMLMSVFAITAMLLLAISLHSQNYSECQGPSAHMNPACNGSDKIEYPRKEKSEGTDASGVLTAETATIDGVVLNATYDKKKPGIIKLTAENPTDSVKKIRGIIALSDYQEDSIAGKCRFFMIVREGKKIHKKLRCRVKGSVDHILISEEE